MNSISNSSYSELIQLRDNLKKNYQDMYPQENIKFGDFSYGYPRILSWGEGTNLSVGKFCSIAQNVTIMLGGEHRPDWITTYPFNALIPSFQKIEGHPKSKGDVVIGNDVWIGSDTKILSGVTIGDGCVVGASSLVVKNMPPYSIWGGVPAKFIKYRFEREIIDYFLLIKWWNWPLEDICKIVYILQSNNFGALFKYYLDNILHKN